MRNQLRAVIVLSVVVAMPIFVHGANTTSAPQQGASKCGSVAYNLEKCGCDGATAVCVNDSSLCKTAPSGVYPIAYVNIGRCKSDCPSGAGIGRGGLQASEGGWNEPWINLKSQEGIARAERLIQQAKSGGYAAIDPDNTAEAVDLSDLKMIVDLAHKYGMKVSLKNEEGMWTRFLSQYPQLRSNIAMVTAEECAKFNDCGKYVPFKQMGIPVTHIEYADKGGSISKLQHSIGVTGGAGMLVPNEKHLNGVTSIGSVCVDANGLTPGPGPTPEQLAALSNGTQPYQQQPGAWANNSQPGAWAPSAPAPAPAVATNPGAGQWKQSDFDRLQPAAQPSYLDTSKTLPKTGEKNPYAQDTAWKDTTVKKTTPEKTVVQQATLFDPLLGKSTKDGATATTVKPGAVTHVGVSGNARVRCTPNTLTLGVKPTIAWSCGKLATSSAGDGFDSFGKPLGSVRTKITKTRNFSISCLDAKGDEIGYAQCTVVVRPPVSGQDAFKDPNATQTEEKKSSLCFLSFCL